MNHRVGVAFAEARRIAWEAASALPMEEVAIARVVGRMLARDVRAMTDVPHYASSAMDGWAVAGVPPWRVISGPPPVRLGAGDAVSIVTGGLVPAGTDAVLPSEHGAVDRGILTPSIPPAAGRHIRPAGEEASRGEVLIPAGTRLNPAHAAVAAGSGHDRLPVSRQPRVGFVLTGSEVLVSGIPGAGHVRDSFDPMLPAVLGLLGAVAERSIRIGDDRDALTAAIGAPDVDLLITTGGTGDSPVDHLRPVLDDLGAELMIDGLAVRPGAPTLLARLPGDTFVLGLPGNPLAAMTGLLTIAPPLIAGLHRTRLPALPRTVVGIDIPGIPGRTTLLPYRMTDSGAVPCARTGSGMLRGLAEADGVLVIHDLGATRGETVETLPLPW